MRSTIIITIGFLAAFLLSSCSSPKTTAQFYQQYKHREGVTNFKMPGWVVWLGGGIAYNSVRNEKSRMYLGLARKVGKMRFMASEDGMAITPEEINSFLSNIRQNGYEDLLHVKDAESNFSILVRDNDGQKLKNLVILGYDDGELFFFDMKSRLKYEDIVDVTNRILSGERPGKKKHEQEEEPPVQEEEEPAVVVPRA
ncbi:MAG: DUF4252 domain-containing protein [Lewinellaceae bacterium]|nr:DUF4252 domain-containing protein [Lewinellaceae bacterium]